MCVYLKYYEPNDLVQEIIFMDKHLDVDNGLGMKKWNKSKLHTLLKRNEVCLRNFISERFLQMALLFLLIYISTRGTVIYFKSNYEMQCETGSFSIKYISMFTISSRPQWLNQVSLYLVVANNLSEG